MFGASRSGKSTIVHSIVCRWSRALIHNPKAVRWLVPPNSTVVQSGAAAAAAIPGRVVYHPPALSPRELRADFDVAVRRLFETRGGGIASHETGELVDADSCGPWLNKTLLQGGELGIPMIYAFQEPVRLWRPFLSQASIVIVLYLGTAHRELLARELSVDALADPLPFDHSFMLWRRADPLHVVHCAPLR